MSDKPPRDEIKSFIDTSSGIDSKTMKKTIEDIDFPTKKETKSKTDKNSKDITIK